ncbi:hypothetical protein D1007_01625 [Hordeum vulgare]|nr:hypothetical protein D1007_01625 [Hordeum vulgare]
MASLPVGLWEGSVITKGNIEYLRRTRKLPSEELVEARAPGLESMMKPRPIERVVFGTHFIVGFGLPRNFFLLQFLVFYGFQVHHLGPNSILNLTCFATLCEAYLGFLPFPSFFLHRFHFCAQMHRDVSYSCGGVLTGRPTTFEDEVEGVLQAVAT